MKSQENLHEFCWHSDVIRTGQKRLCSKVTGEVKCRGVNGQNIAYNVTIGCSQRLVMSGLIFSDAFNIACANLIPRDWSVQGC